MNLYPMMVNISGKKAIVIGGGKIASRKVASLLDSDAMITIISPDLQPSLQRLYDQKKIEWKKKNFAPSDLEDAWIVIAATDNISVNKQISELVTNYQLVNIVDHPEESNFHVPAKFTRGKLTITVSTHGASPTLARKIRDELGETYGESFDKYLSFLEEARILIKHGDYCESKKRGLLREITNNHYVDSEEMQILFIERMRKIDEQSRKKY